MISSSGTKSGEGLSFGFKVSMSSGGANSSRGSDNSMLFNSCEGIQSEIEVQFLNDGAQSDRSIPVRGRKMGGIISFSRGVAESGSAANEFFTWYQNVCDSSAPLKKKILNIMLVDNDKSGKVLAKWEIKGAWPCRWMGPILDISGNAPTVERISFAYESIQKV